MMAKHRKVSVDAVQRIWHKAGLNLAGWNRHGQRCHDFERKEADIIRLYMNPANTPPSSSWT
jgi:hypothetical protein